MRLRLPAPRLLPMTILAMAVLLGAKSVALVRAVAPSQAVAAAKAAPAPAAPGTSAQLAAAQSTAAQSTTVLPAQAPPGPAGQKATAEARSTAAAPRPAASPPAPPVEQVLPAAPPISDSERAILLDLRSRNRELDTQAQSLTAREAAVAAAEKRLAARIDELNSLQKRLEALNAARTAHDEANWKGLVKLYESMKPRDAATIFNDLDLPVLLPVLDRMNDRKAAAILAIMQPERARMVTAELAEMRTHAITPAPN